MLTAGQVDFLVAWSPFIGSFSKYLLFLLGPVFFNHLEWDLSPHCADKIKAHSSYCTEFEERGLQSCVFVRTWDEISLCFVSVAVMEWLISDVTCEQAMLIRSSVPLIQQCPLFFLFVALFCSARSTRHTVAV